MDIGSYLRRIGMREPPSANLAGLRALHRAHLLAVPFENLSVQLGQPVTTEIGPIYEKIVERRRGGWCYEMNGLFGWVLQQLGFDVTRTAAGVMREAGGDTAIGNHLTLQVHLREGPYLADVGFGDGPIEPFPIRAGEFSDGRFTFALSQQDAAWWRLHNHPHGGAKSLDFRIAPADEILLASKCAYLQTWPESLFVQNLVCQRHTPEGFAMLRGRVLRHLAPDGVEERLLNSADELLAALRHHFDLDVPEAASLWPKIVARHHALFGAAG
jgi:N-hydroxyarylamine O-acetyltransferase